MSIKINGLKKALETIEQNPGITVTQLADLTGENKNNIRKWMMRHEYGGIVKTDRSEIANRFTVVTGWRKSLAEYEKKHNDRAREQGLKSRQLQLSNKTIEKLLQKCMAIRPDVKTTWRTEVTA